MLLSLEEVLGRPALLLKCCVTCGQGTDSLGLSFLAFKMGLGPDQVSVEVTALGLALGTTVSTQ